MDNKMYVSVDMMTALIFRIIMFDIPHEALTCICDTLSLQKVKWNIRFFISERLGIRICNQQLLQDFSRNNEPQKKDILQNSMQHLMEYHRFFFFIKIYIYKIVASILKKKNLFSAKKTIV